MKQADVILAPVPLANCAARPEQVPVPDWHREVLAERMATLRNAQGVEKPWEQFDLELTAELLRYD